MVVSPGGAIATRLTTPGLGTMESGIGTRLNALEFTLVHAPLHQGVQCDGELSSKVPSSRWHGTHMYEVGEKVERGRVPHAASC